MQRICKFCKSNIKNYSYNMGWCDINKHIVDDNYSCDDFHYIECCESCHYHKDGCLLGHDILYLDRVMCREDYEERIDL